MPHIVWPRNSASPRSTLPKHEVVATWTVGLVPTESRDDDAQVSMDANQPLSTDGQQASQLPETGLPRHPYEVPALYTPDQRPVAIHGRRGQPPAGRGRSMSHSSPSNSHGKNKGHGHHMAAMEYGSGESSTRAMFGALTPQSLLRSGSSNSAKAQEDRDLRTGKCMTCDSMVRWPKALAVFRCSVCVTINDLTPTNAGQDSRSDRYRHTRRESKPSQNSSPSKKGRQELFS